MMLARRKLCEGQMFVEVNDLLLSCKRMGQLESGEGPTQPVWFLPL